MKVNLAEIARKHGIKPSTLQNRVKKMGMSLEDALSKPFRGNQKCKIDGCIGKYEGLGYCKEHYQQFKRYGDPLVRERSKRGSGSIQNGYIFRSDKQEHRIVAEQALGKPLPDGAVIHHVDGNALNNASTNLVICQSQAYHLLLHQRQNALDACGNPNHRKCVYCGKYDDPSAMRLHGNSLHDGYRHKTCRYTKSN